MSAALSIPLEYSTLIGLLRCAVNGKPPDSDLTSADWPSVLKQARQQGVDAFLFPWLAAHSPALFSFKAPVAGNSAPAAWRSLFLESLSHTLQRQRQLAEILGACACAHISVIPLKGAWLSESVYDDPAQRSMSDLDLLIRADDRDACHALFLALGYAEKCDVLHNTFANDQVYRHATRPYLVEMHWGFTSDMTPDAQTPDVDAIWQRTFEAELLCQPVKQLDPEDLLAHLVQHILHHQFAIPLRSYLDIALLLKRFGNRLSAAGLDAAADRWKVGRAISFVIELVSYVFDSPPPEKLPDCNTKIAPAHYTCALQALFNLSEARARDGELTLLQYQKESTPGRVKLILSRIFMPRAFLTIHYPYARHLYGLPIAWFCRTIDLVQRNRERIRNIRNPGTAIAKNLAAAEMRVALTAALLQQTKKA